MPHFPEILCIQYKVMQSSRFHLKHGKWHHNSRYTIYFDFGCQVVKCASPKQTFSSKAQLLTAPKIRILFFQLYTGDFLGNTPVDIHLSLSRRLLDSQATPILFQSRSGQHVRVHLCCGYPDQKSEDRRLEASYLHDMPSAIASCDNTLCS